MALPVTRLRLRRQLLAHLADLGYSNVRARRSAKLEPELVRVSPVRGHIAFGETVMRSDMNEPSCHERLVSFSQRRTRHRSSILFFIAVAAEDEADLVDLLVRLGIRDGVRGGHVHLVPVEAAPARAAARAASRATSTTAKRPKTGQKNRA